MVTRKEFYTEDAEGAEITERRKKRLRAEARHLHTDRFYWRFDRSTLDAELSMSAEPARRAISMTLRQLVDLYLTLAGQFGQRVSLSSFRLSPPETERLFSSFDEDYHISRFFHFTEADGHKFSIDGVAATHVSIDPEIHSIL